MKNSGLTIINHNVSCFCACKHCFFQSRKTSYGVPYDVGEKIALKFHKWREDRGMHEFSLSYTISHCAEYEELFRNIELNKHFGFIGHSFLQINGIQRCHTNELRNFLIKLKSAGVSTIDTTFYGLEDFHDNFSARKGDFKFLLEIVKECISLGLTSQTTFIITESNKNQLSELIGLLESLGCTKHHGFLPDYLGNGEHIESIRLLEKSLGALPKSVKNCINIRNYKPESQWVADNAYIAHTSRNLVLCLRPDNIDMIETMSCDDIIKYLVDLDEQYYSAIPTIETLSKQYGDVNNKKLYRQRDLHWKWAKAYICDNQLSIYDVTDGRNCGSIRR